MLPEYYKAEDLAAGGLYSEDRHGNQQFFPLLSLSVGQVDAQSTRQCRSHLYIADLASEAKKLAGNSFVVNRRFNDKNAKFLASAVSQGLSNPLIFAECTEGWRFSGFCRCLICLSHLIASLCLLVSGVQT